MSRITEESPPNAKKIGPNKHSQQENVSFRGNLKESTNEECPQTPIKMKVKAFEDVNLSPCKSSLPSSRSSSEQDDFEGSPKKLLRSGSEDLLDPNYIKMKHLTREKMVLTKRVSNKQARKERIAALNQEIEAQ